LALIVLLLFWLVYEVRLLKAEQSWQAAITDWRSQCQEHPQTVCCTAVKCLAFPVGAYLLLIPILYFIARVAIYPGQYVELPSFTFYSQSELAQRGRAFTFRSSYDGTELQGYRTPANSPSSHAVPVVFLGGNGGNGWLNAFAAAQMLVAGVEGFHFEVYSFSYRGYKPNQGAGAASEASIVPDSISFFEAVAAQYNGTRRPLLFAHSLGTGAAVAVAEYYGAGQRDQQGRPQGPACVALVAPYTTMQQAGALH